MNKEEIKKFRQELGSALQIEGQFTHVNADKLKKYGVEVGYSLLTRDEGHDLFNSISEANGVPPLRETQGYQFLDDSVYDALKDAYADIYEEFADNIDAGTMRGSTYAMDGVLNDLDRKVRKDSKHLVPPTSAYSELHFISNDDNIQQTLDKFARVRATYTASWSIRRSVEDAQLERLKDQLASVGLGLKADLRAKIKADHQMLQEEYNAEREQDLGKALDGLDETFALR